MKKNILIIFVFIFILIITGCSKNQKEKSTVKINEEINTLETKISSQISSMSIDEKIGQLLIINFNNITIDETLKEQIGTIKPGGIILFSENITTYDNTINLIKKVKETSSIPLFISIDQEGGDVQRLKSLSDRNITTIPNMYTLGEKNNIELTKKTGKVIAEELKVFGINMDFAPVLDIYSNTNNKVIGKRSFGSTKELVATQGIALAISLEENGIIPVYKHFPGHGDTKTDSHKDLPIINKTKEELLDNEIYPFKEAINNNAKVIMIGHLSVPSITNDNIPASLSKSLITDFLKNELNYNGLIITDALNMKALTRYFTQEEICSKAIEAGVDLLLMPTNPTTCIESIKKSIEEGTISEERINESLNKILYLKYSFIEPTYNSYLQDTYLNNEEHQQVINEILKNN